jgi:hypothetical protein
MKLKLLAMPSWPEEVSFERCAIVHVQALGQVVIDKILLLLEYLIEAAIGAHIEPLDAILFLAGHGLPKQILSDSPVIRGCHFAADSF